MPELQYFIMIPLAAGFLITLFGKRFKFAAEALSVASASAMAFMSISCAKYALTHKAITFKAGNYLPGFGISLFCDGLSVFMLVIAEVVTLAVVLYSIGYARGYTGSWKYYVLLMIMAAGVNGVLLASDIFNLFVFLEVASIAAYGLMAFTNEDEALEGAFKYVVMGAVASGFILLGIALLYGYTSTLNMADMVSVIAMRGPASVIPFVSALFLMGFGLKSALVPFHAWMPDVYTKAPATVAAMSSGVLIKALGVYSLARIFFNVFGVNPHLSNIFIILAVLSMVAGSILAFGQSNIRRLLAYSSISQVGYIFLALGVGSPLAIMGALLHMANHSVSKSLLFLNAGAIEGHYGTSDINKISGVIARDGVCGYTNLTAALSICGIPPLGGFWSKLIIILACVQANRPILAGCAVVVSIFTLIYYFKAYTGVLFAPEASGAAGGYKTNFGMKLAMVALTVISASGGLLLLPGPANLFMHNAISVISSGSNGYINTVFGAIR